MVEQHRPDIIYLPDARGFLLMPVADLLKLPVQQARKKGKLPGNTIEKSYGKEYGKDVLEISKIDLTGKRIAILDDVLATGGTVNAIVEAIEGLGGQVVCANFVYEVDGLGGHEKMSKKGISVGALTTVSEVKANRKELSLPITSTKESAKKKFVTPTDRAPN